MTKKDSVLSFLKSNSFTNPKIAHAEFLTTTGESINYYFFSNIFKQFANPSSGDVQSIVLKKEVKKEVYNLSSCEDLDFPDSILVPFKSETIIDEVLSSNKGLLPATLTIVPGESGVGKTTVLLDALGKIKKTNPTSRMLFVSSEMNRIHMFKYTKRVKITGIDILYLGEYENPLQVLTDVLKEGWDIVLIDSFQDTIDKVKASTNIKANQAESDLLALMDKTRLANNDRGLYTSFICTQHMTKGSVYTGSTRIKHMTDAMLEMKWDGNKRYVEFTKNRDGEVGIKLYYDLTADGVVYNINKFNSDSKVREVQTDTDKALVEANKLFDAVMLGNNAQ